MAGFTPSWTITVDRLLNEAARIRATCYRCERAWDEDLVTVRRLRGGAFSYLGREGVCPHRQCGGKVRYLAIRPGGSHPILVSAMAKRIWVVEALTGTPDRPVIERHEFEDGDQATVFGGRRRAHPEVWLARIKGPDDYHWGVFQWGDARRPWPAAELLRTPGPQVQDR